MQDQIGSGLKNTQQLDVDWSKWENHVFFHSAEAKANIAIDKIINQFPFDGTTEEKTLFYSKIDGFTNWVMEQLDTSVGYAYFTQGTSVWTKDITGWLVPSLTKKAFGESVLTSDMSDNGTCVEFWFNHGSNPSGQTGTYNGLILQKLSGKQGITVATELGLSSFNKYKVHFQISSDDQLSIVAETPELITGEWNHIAFSYYRGSSERVEVFVNGVLVDTTTHQAELDDITTAGAVLYVGNNPSANGIQTHHTDASGDNQAFWGSLEGLEGCLDELRLWSKPRSAQEIKSNMLSNIDSEEGLSYYLKFNEPSSSSGYNSKNIVIDSSGNSYHSILQIGTNQDDLFFINWVNGAPQQTSISNIYGNIPLALEIQKNNLILFPDWPATMSLNTQLVKTGNHYDMNNPNLITKLVPKHYFEEATFFEGIETPIDEPSKLKQATQGSAHEDYSHKYGKLPSKTIMVSFLMVWAAYFDDMKLYIDTFSTLDKVDYTSHEQIPEVLLNFLAEYYGLSIINPFSDETLEKYSDGRNITGEFEQTGALGSLVQQLWRRILVNMPFLLRSRGTMQGIRALMNTIGVESSTFFRLREYGGALQNTISSDRIEQTADIVAMDFSSEGYAQLTDMKAYRHEPGAPDILGGPLEGTILFQAGDITISTPDSAGPLTQFLSGSWAVEGMYQLDPDIPTQSLFHITTDDGNSEECLVNLVASRSDADLVDSYMNVTLYSQPYSGAQITEANSVLRIEGVDLWDGSDWYVNVNNRWESDARVITMYLAKTSLSSVVEWHEASVVVPRDNTLLAADLLYTDPSQNHRLVVSDSGRTVTDPFVQDNENPPDHYGYNGKLYGLKFWTCEIPKKEAIEHCKNPLSISTRNPQVQDAIPRYYRGVPVHRYNGLVRTELPSGGWERLRAHYPGLEGLDVAQSNNGLVDSTQNEYHLLISDSSILEERRIRYSSVSDLITAGLSENKIRVRSYDDENLAEANGAYWGQLYELPLEVGLDDRRFSIESSIVHALNKDMINLLGNMESLNEYIGAPELEYAVDYPELRRVRDLYFKRLTANMPYNSVIEFQRWFNNNFSSLIQDFVPYTADFLGINFVIESHILERHKFDYKQGDVHVDVNDRLAISQVPIIMGTATNNIV